MFENATVYTATSGCYKESFHRQYRDSYRRLTCVLGTFMKKHPEYNMNINKNRGEVSLQRKGDGIIRIKFEAMIECIYGQNDSQQNLRFARLDISIFENKEKNLKVNIHHQLDLYKAINRYFTNERNQPYWDGYWN